jgi:hypothetical protein
VPKSSKVVICSFFSSFLGDGLIHVQTVETDPSKKRPDDKSGAVSQEEFVALCKELQALLLLPDNWAQLRSEQFEKVELWFGVVFFFAEENVQDDDRNSHVDFVAAAGNLRATVYGIKPVDRLEAKV